MVKLNRFIQFNNEIVDTRQLILYERVAKALANNSNLQLTERKLIEFQPKEQQIAISVFWRHRSDEILHKGRLSDVYLLAAGYWRQFSIPSWRKFADKYANHPLRKFATTVFFTLEDFRLVEQIERSRPGTTTAFTVRQQTYAQFHTRNLISSFVKHFISDALVSQFYLAIYEGSVSQSHVDWQTIDIDRSYRILQQVYEAKTTADNVLITEQLLKALEHQVAEDIMHEYNVIGEAFLHIDPFHYHEGMSDAEKGTDATKETIEEVFRSWHRESKEENGVHLQYELEHGTSSTSTSSAATEGDPSATIEEVRKGLSSGDEQQVEKENEMFTSQTTELEQQAGTSFGKEHLHVVFQEKPIESTNDITVDEQLLQWRLEQKPFRRSFVEEIKKRIELKHERRRNNLSKGRLSSNLLPLFIEERPQPFYRKDAPSVQLDAVFGLLVDGSASMMDKLNETKKAVLLFHDVLRQLQVQHMIALYYEDAFNASKEKQPNIFELMHTFQDRQKDSGKSILAFDAHEDNRDGFAIRWMTEKLRHRTEKHKFLLVFSDGEPSAFGYDRNGIVDTTEAVLEAEKKGISVLHLFLSTEQPTYEQLAIFQTMFGNKTAASNSVEDFTNQTIRILRKLLAIVIK